MTRQALIVAHGQPSDPEDPEAEMAAMAAAVASRLPGWRVGSATLAAPGALERALQGLDRPVILPFFMSDGWFIRENLPSRLERAGRAGLDILLPFGLQPGIDDLALELAREGADGAGWNMAETTVILAAHGSGRSDQPAITARATAAHIAKSGQFDAVRIGFIEEDPRLADTLHDAGDKALLLPLFVARWGHVAKDIPAAIAASGFSGRIMDPLGCHGTVPALIAGALSRGL